MITAVNTKLIEPLLALGLDPEDNAERSALEIAKLSGMSSDRWTRDERAKIEAIFKECLNGKELIESLKSANGKGYSGFAYQMIRLQQRFTSATVPALKANRVQLDRTGKAKTERCDRKMLADEFAQLIISKLGSVEDSDEFDPGADPGADPDLYPEIDPEMTSTLVLWNHADSDTAMLIADDNGEIASDTRRSVATFRDSLLAQFDNFGRELGVEAVQRVQLSFQEEMQQGLADLGKVAPTSEAKTTRRTSKKKSV